MKSQNTILKHKQYTFYTKMLNGVVTIAAFVIIGFIVIKLERLSDPNWVIWLIVVIGGIHTFEEYTYPGGFLNWFNMKFFKSGNDDFPLSAKNAFFTDATAGIVIIAILAIVGTNFLWLTLGIVCIFIVNGSWHLTSTMTTGIYSPGALSSALCNLPIGAYILYFYAANGHISLLEVFGAYLLGLTVNILFFVFIRANIKKHPTHFEKGKIEMA